MRRLVAASLLILAVAGDAAAGDWNKPHPHQGVLKPFAADPPPIALSEKEQARLAQGKPVFRQAPDQDGDGGRGTAVFVVDAPPEVVWAVISDFGSYPRWIEDLKETKVYGTTTLPDGKRRIDVYMKAGRLGVAVEYFVRHVFDDAARVGTWTLDYGKESDLEDSIGFWRVTPRDGGKSLVEYSVGVKLRGWVPGFVKELLLDSGLKQATRWVKVQSERRVPRSSVVR